MAEAETAIQHITQQKILIQLIPEAFHSFVSQGI
jgi:hypothetical protein